MCSLNNIYFTFKHTQDDCPYFSLCGLLVAFLEFLWSFLSMTSWGQLYCILLKIYFVSSAWLFCYITEVPFIINNTDITGTFSCVILTVPYCVTVMITYNVFCTVLTNSFAVWNKWYELVHKIAMYFISHPYHRISLSSSVTKCLAVICLAQHWASSHGIHQSKSSFRHPSIPSTGYLTVWIINLQMQYVLQLSPLAFFS